ncbi:bifunctional ADP-dependent NAD(P)H-hydrate dehydratase/NAD(P)H-hydrate epimerase [Enterovibrio calviensis]|uniref:bifunctional ADP-dependent NAD(P)H-hydrate dehydratase/NAD(P)H-hydrate epimerase n=1 Tax=Enterovibrio calviensis TaxID=91359 RepID=UPI000482733D|nr:bifunctional ADP-dependent NAD(P)H-hydrate dehydratase/NAD(P)H-hydrate epimerase [Enterovibrio calviensis]
MAASLPQSLYRSDQVKRGERKIASDLGVEMYDLMERAGLAAFGLLRLRWPEAKKILITCGSGNNGGDGYVIGRLALEAGLHVVLWSARDPETLMGDVRTAKQAFVAQGGAILSAELPSGPFDVIVDALFGTGLSRSVKGKYRDAIDYINASLLPVLAIDIPSGLHADTGCVFGRAIKADCTITFVALKQGLFTGKAADHCGHIVFDGLGIYEAFEAHIPTSVTLLGAQRLKNLQPVRQISVHKGQCGRLLCIGGQQGMGGAIILCGQAALRTGAGLVALLTDKTHINAVLARQPELMIRQWRKEDGVQALSSVIHWADVLALGPGLGQSAWARTLFDAALASQLPMVVDADALNLLSQFPHHYDHWVLTPHPGEAARLLDLTVEEIERDRFSAVKEIHNRYGGVVVLKGAGTIVYDGTHCSVIHAGNPGMASGGMGDVLTGVIASCLAQTQSAKEAARFGTLLHSYAADIAAQNGMRGLLASDLLPLLGNNIE